MKKRKGKSFLLSVKKNPKYTTPPLQAYRAVS